MAPWIGQPTGAPPACWFDVPAFLQRKRRWLLERTAPVVQIWDDLLANLPRDAIVVDDLTLVGYWAPLLRTTYQPGTLLHRGTFGSLGFALLSAIGAILACPGQPLFLTDTKPAKEGLIVLLLIRHLWSTVYQ